MPVKFSHVSGCKKIETSHPTEFQTNSPILRAIARGMAWLRMLDEGKVSSIHDLADTLKLERKYVRYTLRLAFLSHPCSHLLRKLAIARGISASFARSCKARNPTDSRSQLSARP